MCRHSYLTKSRHGVYYFRAVVPKARRAEIGRREVRISLRTKDRNTAKLRAALKALTMTKRPRDLDAWEVAAEHETERLERGLTLVAQHGTIDTTDRFALDTLMQWLSPSELQDYLFALDYKSGALNTRSSQPHPSPATPSNLTPQPAPRSRNAKVPQQANQPSPDTDITDELVAIAIDRFVASKTRSTTLGTAERYGAQTKMFLKIAANGETDFKLSDLTANHVRAYVDALPRLPTRIKSTDTRPIEKIVKDPGPKLSSKTVFSHAQATNLFLSWCQDQQYPVNFDFHKILKPLLKKPRIKQKQKTFTPEQLRALFETEPFIEGAFKRSSDYWVPLLALFTGAREAELCQLVSAVRTYRTF